MKRLNFSVRWSTADHWEFRSHHNFTCLRHSINQWLYSRYVQSLWYLTSLLTRLSFAYRMLKSKLAVGNKRAQADQDCRMQLVRSLELEDRRLLQQLQVKLLTHQAIIYGQAQMIWQKATTIITIARRTPTIINRAHKRICRALTVEPQRQPFGVVTCVVRWCATHVDCTLNCTVSIDHTRCVVTQFTHVDDVQRVISQIEEVSS